MVKYRLKAYGSLALLFALTAVHAKGFRYIVDNGAMDALVLFNGVIGIIITVGLLILIIVTMVLELTGEMSRRELEQEFTSEVR